MSVFIICNVMIVSVGMCHRVGMRRSVMGVGKGMLMRMNVMPDQCIDHDESGARNHHDQCDDIHPGQMLP